MRNPKPTVIYGDTVYKVRSHKTEVPNLDAMDRMAALMWLNRNTYPRGTNNRRPRPNLSGLRMEVR